VYSKDNQQTLITLKTDLSTVVFWEGRITVVFYWLHDQRVYIRAVERSFAPGVLFIIRHHVVGRLPEHSKPSRTPGRCNKSLFYIRSMTEPIRKNIVLSLFIPSKGRIWSIGYSLVNHFWGRLDPMTAAHGRGLKPLKYYTGIAPRRFWAIRIRRDFGLMFGSFSLIELRPQQTPQGHPPRAPRPVQEHKKLPRPAPDSSKSTQERPKTP